MNRVWMTGMAAVLLSIAASSGSAATHAQSKPKRVPCPVVRTEGPYAVEGVTRAVRRDVPLTYQSGVPGVRLTPKYYQVAALVDLGVGPLLGYERYRRIGLRLCSASVVNRSWVAVIHISTAHAVASTHFLLYARTKSGWTAWYHA